jgi:plasmid stabilization system protein ParE
MTPWNIHPAAEDELEAAFEHYLSVDVELAHSFDEHYRRYRQQICENPLLFNLRRPPTRRANLKPRFSEYYIAYMIWREKVVILAIAIAHAKRRPYYWRKRIGEAKQMF